MGGAGGISGGTGGSGAGDDSGAGEYDLTAANYLQCAGLLQQARDSDAQELHKNIADTNKKSLDDYSKSTTDDLENLKATGAGVGNEPGMIRSALMQLLPVSTPCNPPDIFYSGKSY